MPLSHLPKRKEGGASLLTQCFPRESPERWRLFRTEETLWQAWWCLSTPPRCPSTTEMTRYEDDHL